MELGDDYASLAIELNKRRIEPELPEINKLREQVNTLQAYMDQLLRENLALKEQVKMLKYSLENKEGFITSSLIEKYKTKGLLEEEIHVDNI
jgi:cell division protein FtsB